MLLYFAFEQKLFWYPKMKPEIKLYDAVGAGLVIIYPTGITVSNQTGGSACLQSFEEGFYLPMANDCLVESDQLTGPEKELAKYFSARYFGTGATDGINDADAIAVENILGQYNLRGIIKVDRHKLKQSHEAWIYVTIKSDGFALLSYFDTDLNGVLTWNNSD